MSDKSKFYYLFTNEDVSIINIFGNCIIECLEIRKLRQCLWYWNIFSLSVYIIKWGQVFEVDRKNGREQAFKSNKQTKQEIKGNLASKHTFIALPHPTTGYLDNRCYRELRSYLRHTEWQVGIFLTFFFHSIYFLDFKVMSDLLHYKWEICIPNMTA